MSREQTARSESLKNTAFTAPFSDLAAFSDASLANCLLHLHVMWAIEPRVVDWRIVTAGATPDEQLNNARCGRH